VRLPRALLSIGLLISTALLAAAPAAAQQDSDEPAEGIQIRLQYTDEETGDRVPAIGVEFEVSQDGEVLGSDVTDDEGVFRFAVPGPGRYEVDLAEETLPEGVRVRGDRTAAFVNVNAGQIATALFSLETGETVVAGGSINLRRVLQLTVDGIKLGLFLGLAAVGLSLIFGTTGLTNFAHSEMVGFGLLTAYLFNFYGLAGVFGFLGGLPGPVGDGVNLVFAIPIAVILGGVFGWSLDALLFAPLRRRGVSLLAQMIFTIGLAIFLRYFFLFIFGGRNRFYGDYTAQRAIDIGPVAITPKDLVTMVITVIVLVGVGLALQKTRFGKAMRAVSDNRDLAESSGIDVTKVVRLVWTFGGALAALGGAFMALAEQVSWLIGFRILLLIFAGVVLGGLGTAYGALVGCLLIGMGIQLSTLFLPVELKNVGALVVLILVLLVRPQGILGRAQRIG
jgi:neutral amino acid transport system permease protein